MRRPGPRVEVLRRLDDVKGRLEQPTPRPLDGQQAIDLAAGLDEAGMQRTAQDLEDQP